MYVKITDVREYNTWTIWNITNKKEYYDELKSFLIKKLKLEMKNDKTNKKNNNLIEFGVNTEIKSKNQNKPVKTKFKCLFLMTSNINVKDYIFLNMIKKDSDIEAKIDKKIKSLSKEKYEKYKKHYYKISFNKDFEINKRELAKSVGGDYDSMQYRVIKIPGSEGGTMIVFKHAIEFLSYPSKKAFDNDKERVINLVKKNIIKVEK